MSRAHVRIAALRPPDAAEFQALRLRALREDPDAFGSTYAEEVATPIATIAARLEEGAAQATSFILGAWSDPGNELVGMSACFRLGALKERHRATVGGMFVLPEMRGRGIGTQLLDATIARAREWSGLEQLTLTVVPSQRAARALYLSRGFRSFGVAPRALRYEGRYSDVEHFWLPLVD